MGGAGFAGRGFADGGSDEFDELRFRSARRSATSASSWATHASSETLIAWAAGEKVAPSSSGIEGGAVTMTGRLSQRPQGRKGVNGYNETS